MPEFDEHTTSRSRQHLLTWADNQLVYCTHSGAVLAVLWTGQTLWAMRYPSHGPASDVELSPLADLAPCVADDGRVFVAPLDSDRLFCLEACTGRVLWVCEGLDIVHLLGTTAGRLHLATRYGLHAVGSTTGLTVWQQPSEGRLAGQGAAGCWRATGCSGRPRTSSCRSPTLVEGGQQKGDEEIRTPSRGVFDPTQLAAHPGRQPRVRQRLPGGCRRRRADRVRAGRAAAAGARRAGNTTARPTQYATGNRA